MTTTNFPNGVTNASRAGNPFGDLTFPDPTLVHTYFNDFDQFVAADWTVLETQAGATQALTAGDGGLMLLTNTATDDDLCGLQKTPANFALTAGKKAWHSTRFKASDVTQLDILVGLVIINATPIATPPTDGIYFLSADGVATMQIISRKNATTGSTAATVTGLTLANDTFVTVQWYYDGTSRLYYGFNGTVVGSLDITNYFPDATNLAPMLVMQAGEAGAETMTVDWTFTAVER